MWACLPPRRSLAGLAAAALAFVPAAPAAADGLPLPVEESPNGVATLDGASRYLSVTVGGRTAVLAQKAATGAVTSRLRPARPLRDPARRVRLVGRRPVRRRAHARAHPPARGVPAPQTTFAVLSTRRWLRLRRTVHLPGDFSYDALSPDGRALFSSTTCRANDPTKYRVRVYDLARNRLEPKAIVDPREDPDEMNGLPLARATSSDGRWAYTLYQGTAGEPFIHALDTRDRKAVCIDLHDPALARGNPYELRLLLAAGGARLDVRRRGALLATVDAATFRVLSGPAAAASAARARADGNPAGPSMLWPAVLVALLGAALATARVRRRRAARSPARLGLRLPRAGSNVE